MEVEYACFFCGQGIPENDPERRDLIVNRATGLDREEVDFSEAVWYACHRACLDRAEGLFDAAR